MKDKLRELADEWSDPAIQKDWRRGYSYAAELLAILDAEGDGGAVPVGWVFQHDETGRMTFCENDGVNNPENFAENNPRHALCGPAYTHPARSVVVSDEDVRDALNIFVGGNQYTSDHQCHRMRAALEFFAKSHGVAGAGKVPDDEYVATIAGWWKLSEPGGVLMVKNCPVAWKGMAIPLYTHRKLDAATQEKAS